MATFDFASNTVLDLIKLLETVYDCSDIATLSLIPTEPNILTIKTMDAFACSQHIATVPIILRECTRFNVEVNVLLKKLSKSLKKTKNCAIRFVIVSGKSLKVTPANHLDTVVYQEASQYDLVFPPEVEEKKIEYIPVTLVLVDLATMVINLCLGSGFVSFRTQTTGMLHLDTKTPSCSIAIEKKLQCDVPAFETVIVIKLLKVLTHSSLPSIKTVVCYIPTEKNIPVKFCVEFSKCTLTTILYDQSKYM